MKSYTSILAAIKLYKDKELKRYMAISYFSTLWKWIRSL